jgi:hypothetical protein
MHKFLKVKIFAADRIVYQGGAATIALRFFNANLEVMCPFEDRFPWPATLTMAGTVLSPNACEDSALEEKR